MEGRRQLAAPREQHLTCGIDMMLPSPRFSDAPPVHRHLTAAVQGTKLLALKGATTEIEGRPVIRCFSACSEDHKMMTSSCDHPFIRSSSATHSRQASVYRINSCDES